jgi:long-chain acyl-CoA synthetase
VRRDTLIDFFQDLVQIDASFLAFDDGYRRREYTYEQAGRAARGFAVKLARAGLMKGDKVVFWGENRPEWVVCYWGCLLAGVVVVPIDYRSSRDFVAKVTKLVEARVVVVGEDVEEERLHGHIVWRFADLDWKADGPMPVVPISREDVTQIIFTSGATADPKGVVIRHRNVLANIVPVEREVQKYKKYARPFHPLRFLNLLPLSHMFGQSMATSIPPMVRGLVIFTRSFNPYDILALIHRRRISVLVCVPKILGVLREHVVRTFPETADPPPQGISIPGRWWRYRRVHNAFGLKFWAFVVGAAPLPADIEEFWRRLGFAVIQGYGLTETAPIVTLNHPFKTSKGSVGTPIAGVEVRIAEDGEILVRGDNVTSGYYEPGTRDPGSGIRDPGEPGVSSESESRIPSPESRVSSPESRVPSPESRVPNPESRIFDNDGWLHTGDIGERDAEGRLFIKGRKKEMIVRPDGLNVFPEDVERVLDAQPGVRESAVVGVVDGAEERVHAVLVLEPDVDPHVVIRNANAQLQDHQRIRTSSVWPAPELPRTEGTRKLKRRAIGNWVQSGAPAATAATGDSFEALLGRFAHGRDVDRSTTLDELGLSSLERVELMVALEDRFQTRIDEGRFSEMSSIGDLKQLVERGTTTESVDEPVDFPVWNRSWPVHVIRRISQATWILPLARVFAHSRIEGLDHLRDLSGPVVFAANHQSHMDVPVILAALPGRWRARVAPAMAKEFFKAHFFQAGFTWRERFTNTLNYYLAAFYFNAFPLPQREAGARQTLQYIGELTGDGWSILIFPEGMRSATGHIKPFRGGIGMIASRLDVPIVPIRIDDVDKLLPVGASFLRPGRVRVAFGAPLRLRGADYASLASTVEQAVRDL